MLNIKNTIDGFLKDIEIKGNTIQDINQTGDLADIRSVGDKLENQELYEIPVLSTTINLFDKNNYLNILEDYDYIISEYKCKKIKLKPNTNYCISAKSSSSVGLLLINNNSTVFTGSFVDFRSSEKLSKILTTDGNGFLYIGTKITDVNLLESLIDRDIQIEEGDIESPYSEHYEHKLTILSPVQLEKVGDIADRIICKDGVWGVEKNIGNKILDGVNINYDSWRENVNTIGCLYAYSDERILKDGTHISTISYELPSKNYIDLYSHDVEGISGYISNQYGFVFRINKSKLNGLTIIEYFNQNPLTVKYQLAQPTFIPLPHDQQIALRTFANKTNIHFECEIEPTLKASVPKSLGASVSSHSEQIDNLSKELEKINNLEESVTSEVVSESDFITVENTSNGYFEDVKLEGRTLVNLIDVSDWLAKETTITATDKTIVNSIYIESRTSKTIKAGDKLTLIPKLSFSRVSGSGQCYFRMNYTTVDNIDKMLLNFNEFDNSSHLITIPEDFKTLKAIFVGVYPNTSAKFKNNGVVLLEGDHTDKDIPYFEGLKSVGQDVDEISVLSTNKEETKQDKKRILYYNDETQAWEKPILRQWDSIEKHSDNKYHYHVRSEEVPYTEGDETKVDHITDMTTTVKKISTEKVYECTDLDLITYSGETNLLVKSGVLNPKVTLKVKKGIGNVVTMLQNKVAMLEDLVNKLIQK